jgi:hypothetical protein
MLTPQISKSRFILTISYRYVQLHVVINDAEVETGSSVLANNCKTSRATDSLSGVAFLSRLRLYQPAVPKAFANLPKAFANLNYAFANLYPQTDTHSRTLTLSPPAGSRHNSVTEIAIPAA